MFRNILINAINFHSITHSLTRPDTPQTTQTFIKLCIHKLQFTNANLNNTLDISQIFYTLKLLQMILKFGVFDMRCDEWILILDAKLNSYVFRGHSGTKINSQRTSKIDSPHESQINNVFLKDKQLSINCGKLSSNCLCIVNSFICTYCIFKVPLRRVTAVGSLVQTRNELLQTIRK